MELNVGNVMAVKSALDKRQGHGRQDQKRRQPADSFIAALGRATGQEITPAAPSRRDGFAPGPRPSHTVAGSAVVHGLHRHVLWVNDMLADLYGVHP